MARMPRAVSARDALIEDNIGLVVHIAHRIAGRMPNERDRDELIGAGMIGLVEAATRFDPERGMPFSSFAGLRIEGASEHTLRNLTVRLPLGVFACVTGVSGSGKSTLVHRVLYENLLHSHGIASENTPGRVKKLSGAEQVGQVILVDQSPLARTPKSTPALYLGVFDRVRELFACTEHALREGLTASAFSFNGGTGRCERCGGSSKRGSEASGVCAVAFCCAGMCSIKV